MMKTISKRRVLSSACVPELNTLWRDDITSFTYTASMRQKRNGPQRSPIVAKLKGNLTVSDLASAVLVEDWRQRVDHDEQLVPDLLEILLLYDK